MAHASRDVEGRASAHLDGCLSSGRCGKASNAILKNRASGESNEALRLEQNSRVSCSLLPS